MPASPRVTIGATKLLIFTGSTSQHSHNRKLAHVATGMARASEAHRANIHGVVDQVLWVATRLATPAHSQ